LLNVIFLLMITASAAMILLNAAPRARNPQSTFRLIALNLANEQFAQLESLAATGENISGSYSFLGVPNDLKNFSFRKKNSTTPIEFTINTTVNGSGNLRKAKVTVKIVGDENFKLEAERTIRIVQPTETQ
jgi:hypothetical protein